MKQLIFLLFFSFTIFQQAHSKTITGKVVDQSNLPLPGVNIYIFGTSKGVQTDFDGNYSIEAEIGQELYFSYVGMITQTIKIGNSNIINVILKEDNSQLDEVVITGYARSKTYSKRLNSSVVYSESVSNRLAGSVSGVQISNFSGQPGSGSKVYLRSKSSLNIDNDPLFVLNGKIISKEKFSDIKIKKIKHVEILKDKTATALYGARGVNGVIIINTRGKKNNTDISIINDFLEESYSEIKENHFKSTVSSPLSTFSIDVDKASYSNIRRMINNGQKVPKDAVKIEEMINYFDYNYPQPEDEHPFSISTEVSKTPWHEKTNLVRIGLQGKTIKTENLPSSNLTFLIDVSGSMGSQNKLALLKSAFKLLVNQLRAQDKVSIVVYAGAAGIVLEPTKGSEKKKILEALNNLQAGGSTAGGEGIELAYTLASQNFIKNGNNRVILATDGDFNVGATSNLDMEKLIEEKRKSGVFLSVLGFGYGNYKDSKLEALAQNGNGNHAYIDTLQEAQHIFGKEFGGTLYTIAKDVKIQIEFNPNNVEAYRLIGYENRLLNDEDFKDDTKDAGELGSGHTVTALYEIIPKGVKTDYAVNSTELKYTKASVDNSNSDELFTIKFRYKKPNSNNSIEIVKIQKDEINEASNDMNFVAAVALFGMKLRDSKYDNQSNIDKVLELANSGKLNDTSGYKAEFIRLVNAYKSTLLD